MFLTMWLVGVPAALGVVSTFTLNGEVQAVRREVRDGMYHPCYRGVEECSCTPVAASVAYVLAHTSLQLPMMVFLAISAIGVPAYAIADFNESNFVQFTLVYALMLWAFECIAQLCSLLRNPLLGMFGFLNTWFASFLFCGIFLRKTDVIWPFRAFTYLLSLAWAFPSLNYFEFIDYESIGGAEACSNVTEPGCFDVLGGEGPPFRCPDLQPQQCLGLTGRQVLVSLGKTYKMIDVDVNTTQEALISHRGRLEAALHRLADAPVQRNSCPIDPWQVRRRDPGASGAPRLLSRLRRRLSAPPPPRIPSRSGAEDICRSRLRTRLRVQRCSHVRWNVALRCGGGTLVGRAVHPDMRYASILSNATR